MANDYGFGVSFMPGGDSMYRRQRPGQQGPSSVAPMQEAIKILSLRMPRVVGANPLAPMSLLGGQGGGGLPEGLLQQLLRTQGMQPATNAGGPMSGPGQIGIQGATSPFMQGEGSRAAGYGPGAAPPVSVTAGLNDPGAAGAPPPPSGAPQLSQPPAPTGGGGVMDESAPDLWELARRQREGMGRISY